MCSFSNSDTFTLANITDIGRVPKIPFEEGVSSKKKESGLEGWLNNVDQEVRKE